MERRYRMKQHVDGLEIIVHAPRQLWRVIFWSIFHLASVIALPWMAIHECPSHVIALCAVPIVFAFCLYLIWISWQLSGNERYHITSTSWSYEACVGNIRTHEIKHYDYNKENQPQLIVDGTPARLRFDGHLKMGYAFYNEQELRLFLADITKYFDTNLSATEMLLTNDLPLMDDVMNAMIPMLDLSERGQEQDVELLEML